MIDELLGRATLKERIEELEEETERLRRRYEAESDRRADAITDKQEAEREQNKLEDRIAQLKGELERQRADQQSGAAGTLEPRRRDRLSRGETATILDRLESFRAGPEGACTAVVPDGEVPDAVSTHLGPRQRLLEGSDTYVVCYDDADLLSVALAPPIGPASETPRVGWSDRFDLEREWFLPRGRFTLALVRADLFALGVYDGEDRQDFHGFESDVKSSHSKGGFSQGRFERIRDGQIADHLERARSALAEHRDGSLYLVGQQEAISRLSDHLEPHATATVDATGAPKAALEDAFRDFFRTELVVLG